MPDRRGACLKALELVKVYEGKRNKNKNHDESSIALAEKGTRTNDRPISTKKVVDSDDSDEEEDKKEVASNDKMAVKGVSFYVRQGEIFALLGLNGAGKTSTFNMMVGDESLSGGEIIIDDLPINHVYRKPHYLDNVVGYCRQGNELEAGLTVVDYLKLICNLVGVKEDKVDRVVDEYLIKFNLGDYKDTFGTNLSGGNKRKLICAIAMLGQPQAIFIDEASAGVDPGARRILWHGIKEEGKNSAVVITTHAMEEAEALAKRISIMASGRFKCIGTLH